MTQYEMTEKLSEKTGVTFAEAQATLEAGDWNMLTATQMLDQEKFRRMQELHEVAADCEAMEDEAAADESVADESVAEESAEEKRTKETGKRRLRQRNLGKIIRRAVACGNRNHFVVRRGGAELLELPVTVLVVLLLCAFWVCVPALVVGLFAGCQYGFNGAELNRENLNKVLDRVSDAVEHLKDSPAKA